MENKERKYLEKLINEFKGNEDLFIVYYGDSTKFIRGTFTPIGEKQNLMAKIINFKTLNDTINDLDYKVKISLFKALDCSYSKNLQMNFNIFDVAKGDEFFAYYYIENAVFRIQSLWDLLAQLYCARYELDIEPWKIGYKMIFNSSNQKTMNKFKKKVVEISNYINEEEKKEDEFYPEGRWRGNHKFVNEYRNKMTHRNSPNISSMSDFDFNMKEYPVFILKRLVEDYNQVGKYLLEILDSSNEYIIAREKKESLI